MFKSSFAREILEETRHNAGAASSLEATILLPAVRHPSRYRSNFAASTHSVLDNLAEDSGGSEQDEDEEDVRRTVVYPNELHTYRGQSVSSSSARQVFGGHRKHCVLYTLKKCVSRYR